MNHRYVELDELKQAAGNIAYYSRRKLSDDELRVELERENRFREEAEKRALEAKLVS